MANPPDKKKTMDVSKPGKTSPESTSRPIIVTNRSIVKDPTLTQGDEATDDPELSQSKPKIPKIVSNEAKTIQPIETSDEDDKPADGVPEVTDSVVDEDDSSIGGKDKSEESDKTEKTEDAEAEKDDKPADDNENSEDEKPSETETTEDTQELDPTIADKKKENKQTAEDKAHKELVEKLVKEGKYVVPIGHVKRRRNMRYSLIILALLLIIGVVATDLLIDAGIIKTDIKPVVDLIKN